ncbi:MAG: hypothetical protein US74_C0050G0008 [Parcubacteria group bacterium GW2011_GWA2_38_13]|nr:MAG: hypothetical protein US74_C0050G0008 [Parcubacteria group bacterium GW2011_GWA2_38_13]
MLQTSNANNKYNLEARCLQFAKSARDYIHKLPPTITNIEYGKQLTRSSGSMGANYIEANESLSRKDFSMRIKISKKESKESIYWLELIQSFQKYEQEKIVLIQEATELMKIFGSISEKTK